MTATLDFGALRGLAPRPETRKRAAVFSEAQRARSLEVRIEKARERRLTFYLLVMAMRRLGLEGAAEMAAWLNSAGVRTARGGEWNANNFRTQLWAIERGLEEEGDVEEGRI